MPQVQLVLANQRLATPGGSESYLLTVAGQLERLGNDVWVYALEQGEMAELARQSGLQVARRDEDLPDAPDAFLSQDGIVAYELAARYPDVPQLFVAHSADYDLQRPPAVDGVVSAVVALNDRVGRLLKTLPAGHDVIRLRQPIDIRRFTRGAPIRPKPRQLVMLSNSRLAGRRELVERACTAAGISCELLGEYGEMVLEPHLRLARADIVVACGRSALEGMACGRAVYVLGHLGADGWVEPERYAELEADGFAGMASPRPIEPQRLAEDLVRGYRPTMGDVNRELVVRRHRASEHAVELAGILASLTRRPSPAPSASRELARMVRVQWHTDSRAALLTAELRETGERLRAAEADALAARELAAAWERRHDEAVRSRRYRLAAALAAPVAGLRRLRPRWARHSGSSSPRT